MRRTIKLQIRQDHIDGATRRSSSCPAARALRERYPGLPWRVGNHNVALRKGGKYVKIGDLGSGARNFTLAFDNRGKCTKDIELDMIYSLSFPIIRFRGPILKVSPCTVTIYAGKDWPDEPETVAAEKLVRQQERLNARRALSAQ